MAGIDGNDFETLKGPVVRWRLWPPGPRLSSRRLPPCERTGRSRPAAVARFCSRWERGIEGKHAPSFEADGFCLGREPIWSAAARGAWHVRCADMPPTLSPIAARTPWPERFAAGLRRQSARRILCWGIGLVAAVGVVDYATGYEIDCYPFYSVPILLVACFGRRADAVWIVGLSAVSWWCADTGHAYSRELIREWELVVRVMFFCLALLAGLSFRRYRDAIRARVELLEKSRQLEGEIISISERERQRIGRDLHDGLCQYLAAISFTADWLRRDLQREAHPRTATAGEIMDLLQDAITRAREMARGLSPVDHDEGGLEAALEELAASTARLTGVACSFLCDEPTLVRNNVLAVHLFRIAQEAINNALRHGRAKTVIIALEASHGELVLRVSDDGTGCYPVRRDRGGMGLNIMRYRSDAVGGTLEIYSNEPTGTVVACTMGYPAAVAPIPSLTPL